MFGDDPELAGLLREKEREQARARGIAWTRRPREDS